MKQKIGMTKNKLARIIAKSQNPNHRRERICKYLLCVGRRQAAAKRKPRP